MDIKSLILTPKILGVKLPPKKEVISNNSDKKTPNKKGQNR